MLNYTTVSKKLDGRSLFMENNQSGTQLEMNFNASSGNRFRRCLENGVFTVLFEHTPPGLELSDEEAALRFANLEKLVLGCRTLPAALAVTDRAVSDKARRAIDYAALLPAKNRNSHIFYLSGRNTDANSMQGLIAEAAALDLANVVAVSGDSRIGESSRDLRKMPFTESVKTLRYLQNIKPVTEFFAGATVNAHIYSAPGLYSSLFKLVKKFNCNAGFAVTQAGFDMAQLDALRRYLSWRGYNQPLIARLMLLTPEKVEKITAGSMPGLRLTNDFLNILEKELQFSSSQFEAAQYRRLELQAAGCKLLGYNGIQIAGADTPSKMNIALDRISKALEEFTSFNQWIEEYKYYMARTDMAPEEQHFYLFEDLLNNPGTEDADWQLTEFKLPELSFRQKIGYRARKFFFPEADQQDAGERFWLKKMLAGCRQCGKCRLPQTQFHCPELCPKRLTNGNCGGVKDNGMCEAGNFPCVHLQIWYAAEKNKNCDALENGIIE